MKKSAPLLVDRPPDRSETWTPQGPRRRGGRQRRWARGLAVVAVCALSGFVGLLGLDRFARHRESATVERFLAGIDDQVATVDGLYRRSLHDIRAPRRELATQLGAMARELGLDRSPARRSRETTAMGRLYAALGQDATAVQFYAAAWQDGAPSDLLAEASATAHGRTILDEWVCHGPESAPDGASADLQHALSRIEASRQVLASPSTAEPEAVGTEREAILVWWTTFLDALQRGLEGETARIGVAAAQARRNPQASVWGPAGGAGWAGYLELWHGDLLWRSGAAEQAHEAWRRAIEDLRSALVARPSDLRLHRALCATWARRLNIERRPTEPGGIGGIDSHAGMAGSAAPFSQAEASCQDGLRVDGGDPVLLVAHSRVDLAHARRRLAEGADPRPYLADSRQKLERIRRRGDAESSHWAAMLAADEKTAAELEEAWHQARRGMGS